MSLGGLGKAQGRLEVNAQLPRLGQVGKGLESRVVDELVGAQARGESAPRLAAKSCLAALAVPMTWAPRALAIWTARCPTQPPAL